MTVLSFLLGCYVGGVVGITLGIVLMAILVSGKREDKAMAQHMEKQ